MSDLELLEEQIAVTNSVRELRDTCVKLMDSPYFKDVVEEGYFKEEAARLVMAKSAPLDDKQMKLIDNMIYGVGAFQNYLHGIMRRGAGADDAIADQESERESILQEELTK